MHFRGPVFIATALLSSVVLVAVVFGLSLIRRTASVSDIAVSLSSGLVTPSLAVDFSEPVAMCVAASPRYVSDEDDVWQALLPGGGHTLKIDGETYTPTLFHQLKCLDVIRREYQQAPVAVASGSARHCMNYLRQTLLCHPNLGLERAISPIGPAEKRYDTVCRDWMKVYAKAEELNEIDRTSTS